MPIEQMDLAELLSGCEPASDPQAIAEMEKKLELAAKIARQMTDREVVPPENIFGAKKLSKLIVVTPTLARQLYSKNVAKFQRTVSNSRLTDLMQKMADGRFHGNKIALALFQKQLILMNGQHTLLAILNTGEAEENWVEVVQCQTEAQLGCYWAQFDDDGKRTPKQQCAALATALGDEWSKDQTQVLSIACSLVRYKTAAKGVAGTLQERVQLIPKFEPHASIAKDIIFNTGFTRQLKRGPVAQAILLTVMADADDARKFWGAVATGLNMDREDAPQKVLRDYLLNFKGSNTGKRTDSDKGLAGKCLEAWNYYRDGIDVPRRGRSKTPTLVYKDINDLPEAQ